MAQLTIVHYFLSEIVSDCDVHVHSYNFYVSPIDNNINQMKPLKNSKNLINNQHRSTFLPSFKQQRGAIALTPIFYHKKEMILQVASFPLELTLVDLQFPQNRPLQVFLTDKQIKATDSKHNHGCYCDLTKFKWCRIALGADFNSITVTKRNEENLNKKNMFTDLEVWRQEHNGQSIYTIQLPELRVPNNELEDKAQPKKLISYSLKNKNSQKNKEEETGSNNILKNFRSKSGARKFLLESTGKIMTSLKHNQSIDRDSSTAATSIRNTLHSRKSNNINNINNLQESKLTKKSKRETSFGDGVSQMLGESNNPIGWNLGLNMGEDEIMKRKMKFDTHTMIGKSSFSIANTTNNGHSFMGAAKINRDHYCDPMVPNVQTPVELNEPNKEELEESVVEEICRSNAQIENSADVLEKPIGQQQEESGTLYESKIVESSEESGSLYESRYE